MASSSNWTFAFYHGNNERLRISSDGRTLINTTAVTNTHDQLTVKRPASGFGEMTMTVDANTSTSSAANAFIFTKSKHTYWNGYGFQSSHGHIGAIVAKRDSTGGDSDQEIRIEIGGTHINQSEEKTWNFKNNGDLSISDGNLVVASGHGIDFSATAGGSGGSSEILTDYEQGTFTATLSASGGGASFASGSTTTGLYVKIGSMVHVQGYFSGTNVTGGGTGIVKVSGLPFASNNTTYYTICLTHNTMTAQQCTGAYIQYANTYFFPIQTGATSGSAFNVGNPRYMMFGGSYPVQF